MQVIGLNRHVVEQSFAISKQLLNVTRPSMFSIIKWYAYLSPPGLTFESSDCIGLERYDSSRS